MLGEILLSFLKNDLALVGSVGAGCIMIAGKHVFKPLFC